VPHNKVDVTRTDHYETELQRSSEELRRIKRVVEVGVKYVKGNFVPAGVLRDLAGLDPYVRLDARERRGADPGSSCGALQQDGRCHRSWVLPDSTSGGPLGIYSQANRINASGRVVRVSSLGARIDAFSSGNGTMTDVRLPARRLVSGCEGLVTAFMSGLRQRLRKCGVAVVTLKPGFADTAMTAAFEKEPLWTCPERVAAGSVRGLDRSASGSQFAVCEACIGPVRQVPARHIGQLGDLSSVECNGRCTFVQGRSEARPPQRPRADSCIAVGREHRAQSTRTGAA